MRLPRIIIPILVLVALVTGIGLKSIFSLPTVDVLMADPDGKSLKHIAFTVQGVKCAGTSNFFAERYRGVPGVVQVTCFADEHKAVIAFEPTRIGPDSLRRIFEAPVVDERGNRYDSVFVWQRQISID